jgi:hypothetical protein
MILVVRSHPMEDYRDKKLWPLIYEQETGTPIPVSTREVTPEEKAYIDRIKAQHPPEETQP